MLRFVSIRYPFSIVSTVRHPPTRTFRGRQVTLDTHDSLRHHELIVAFKQKRTVSKSEVWPKIAVVQQELSHIHKDLQKQQIQIKQKQMNVEDAGNQTKIHNQNIMTLSEKILLKFKEPHLVSLFNAYLSKILVNGRMPRLQHLSIYNRTLLQIISLYKIFFFGQDLTPLQQTLQLHYLYIKKQKYEKINSQSFKCFWTNEDTRNINKYHNWQHRPSVSFQKDRPFYIPHDVTPKLQSHQTINNMMTLVFPFNLKWKLFSQYEFIAGSKLYFDSINHEHMHRIIKYLNCEEFLSFVNLPADFEIEMAIIDCHIWMLIDRIKKIPNSKYKYLATRIETSLKSHGINKVSHLAVKKPDRFAKVIKSNTDKHFKAFTYHFNMAGFSRDNLYKGIDALVWSNVFMQKVERYSEIVYKFSEYLVKNYQKIQNEPIENINRCMIEFDIYLEEPGYKEKIEKINPRVPKEEFEKEFAQDKEIKSYYYNYLVSKDEDVKHYSKVYPNENQELGEKDMKVEQRKHVESSWEKGVELFKRWSGDVTRSLRDKLGLQKQ